MPATALVLPPQPVPVIDAGGLVSLPWRSSLQNALNNLQAQITALAALEGDTTALETALAALQAEVDAAEASIAAHIADTANPHATTAAQVGADPAGTATAAVAAHVALADPHTQYLTEAAAAAGYQPLDATLTALSGANWALNALPIGSGADTVSQVAFAANTFPARASTGNLVAKAITDGALNALAGAGTTAQVLRGDGTLGNNVSGPFGVGTTTPGYVGFTNAISLLGATNCGYELVSSRADANDSLFGSLASWWTTASPGHNRSAEIQFSSDGTTANQRGGRIAFWTKQDASTTLAVRWVIRGPGGFEPGLDNVYSFGSASLRVASDHVVQRNTSGAEYQTGIQTPAQFTANTDNFALTSTTRILRASTDASRNLTGITGGASGRRLTIANVGAFDLVLVHDATSTAANRFFCPNNVNLTIRQNGFVEALYDATSSRWRVMGV